MLEEKSVIGYWTVKTSEKLWQTKILALAENSEKILYSLDRRFGQGETFRAILLFFVNIVCINLASIITFRLQGIGPRSWWEANKAGKAVKVTIIGWLVVLGLLALSLFLSKAL